jgi:hypothetical protein
VKTYSILRAGRVPAIGAVGLMLAVAMISASTASASTPAATPAVPMTVVGLSAASAQGLLARAANVRDALGFPSGTGRSAVHVTDHALGGDYDAVEETGRDGIMLAEFRFSTSGRLQHAVRLDSTGATDRRLSRARASSIARIGLAALGLAPAGAEVAEADAIQGGWQVHWSRGQRGVAVRGDETRVQVRADGSIGAVAWVEHDLAVEPVRRLTGTAASAVVRSAAAGWFAETESGFRLGTPALEWVEPNGLFDGAVAMSGAGPYRLAWVVDVRPTGPAAMSLTLISVFVDAGDGSVIGGDVVQ